MPKLVQGYVRDIETAVGLAGVQVEIRAINGGGLVLGGTTNPTNTDPSGLFTWSRELSPGPVEVHALIGGSEKKIRSGKEQAQIGDLFISDLPEFNQVFSDGVIDNRLNEFAVTAVPGQKQVSVASGRAVVSGRVFTIDTPVVKNLTTNSTLAVRHDLTVLRQWVSGNDQGKQDIVVVEGVLTGVDPTINNVADTKDLVLARSKLNQNGLSVASVDDLRTYASVFIAQNSIQAIELSAEGNTSTSDTALVLKAPSSGLTPVWDTLSAQNLSDVAGIGTAAGMIAAGNHTHAGLTTTDEVGFVSAIDSTVSSDNTFRLITSVTTTLTFPGTYDLYVIGVVHSDGAGGTSAAAIDIQLEAGVGADVSPDYTFPSNDGDAILTSIALWKTTITANQSLRLLFRRNGGPDEVRARRGSIFYIAKLVS